MSCSVIYNNLSHGVCKYILLSNNLLNFVMSGRYGRTYTRRRRARDVRRAEERAAHTTGVREEEVTTSG
jgi:hypothetical protein